MNKEHTIFVEKYRPTEADEFIGNEKIIKLITNWITEKDIPHLLFYGVQGTGKTTLAKLLANKISGDNWIYINASDENNIETVRTKVKNFASSMSFGGIKIIILDESDYLTPQSQAALRSIIEQYSNTTRFIFTCNYINKLIPPIVSRLQPLELEEMNKVDIAKRCAFILQKESIEFKPEDLKTIINLYFPDVRKIINELQKNVVNNKLEIIKDSITSNDYKYDILNELKSKTPKTFNNIRKIVLDNGIKDFNVLYTFLFDHIDEISDDFINIVIALQEAQYQDSFSIDKEICFMSCIAQIIKIKNN